MSMRKFIATCVVLYTFFHIKLQGNTLNHSVNNLYKCSDPFYLLLRRIIMLVTIKADVRFA